MKQYGTNAKKDLAAAFADLWNAVAFAAIAIFCIVADIAGPETWPAGRIAVVAALSFIALFFFCMFIAEVAPDRSAIARMIGGVSGNAGNAPSGNQLSRAEMDNNYFQNRPH